LLGVSAALKLWADEISRVLDEIQTPATR
jgi:hypothetical protein